MRTSIIRQRSLAILIALLICFTNALSVLGASFGTEKDLVLNEDAILLFEPKGGVFLDGTIESWEVVLPASHYDEDENAYYAVITQEDMPTLRDREGCTFEGWYLEGQKLAEGDRIYDGLVHFDAKWKGANQATVSENVAPFFNDMLPEIYYGDASDGSSFSVRALKDNEIKSAEDITSEAEALDITAYDADNTVQLDMNLTSGTPGSHGVVITMPIPDFFASADDIVAIHYGTTTEAIACEISGDTLSFTLENFSPVILMKGKAPETATVFIENVKGGALVVFDASRGQKVLPVGEDVKISRGATLYTYPYPMEETSNVIQCTSSNAKTKSGRLILESSGVYAGVMQITITQDTIISATFERVATSTSSTPTVHPEQVYFPVAAGNTSTLISTALTASRNKNVLNGATFSKSMEQGAAGFAFDITEQGVLTSTDLVPLGSYTVYVDVAHSGQTYEKVPVTLNSGSAVNIELYIADNVRSGDLLNMLAMTGFTPFVAQETTLADLKEKYIVFPVYHYDTFAGVYDANGKIVADTDSLVPQDKNYYFLRHVNEDGSLYRLTVPALSRKHSSDDSSSDGSSSGGSSSSSASSTALTTKVGGIAIPYTKGNGIVTLNISDTKIKEIVTNTDAAATFDLREVSGTMSAVLPVSVLEKLANANLGAAFKLPQGEVHLDAEGLSSITKQAVGTSVTITLEKAESASLTEEQLTAAGDNTIYSISIVSSNQTISSFAGGEITITLPYTLKDGEDPAGVCVWYLDSNGTLETIRCIYDEQAKAARFTIDHLSYYVVGYNAESNVPTIWNNPFQDVRESDWFYQDVAYVVQNGLFSGTSPAAFSPNLGITRGMLVTVLWRMAGSPEESAATFSDVPDGTWYTDAVAWASSNGIASGMGDGLFAPDASITREQMAVFLYHYAKSKDNSIATEGTLSQFSDGEKVSTWALDAIRWATDTNLISGKSDTMLVPQGGATRAEVGAVLHRFMESQSSSKN